MGRRSMRLVFMPGKYVFPGGRIETVDLRHAEGFRLDERREERLLAGTAARFDTRRAIGVALAAIRETFEEVGLAVGRPGGFPGHGATWKRFAATGISPDPAALAPVARAITPPGMPRRYDTRFFCVAASDIGARLAFEQRSDDEFESFAWFSLDDLGALDLPRITRQVLADLDARLRDGSWRDSAQKMPFYRAHRGGMVPEMI